MNFLPGGFAVLTSLPAAGDFSSKKCAASMTSGNAFLQRLRQRQCPSAHPKETLFRCPMATSVDSLLSLYSPFRGPPPPLSDQQALNRHGLELRTRLDLSRGCCCIQFNSQGPIFLPLFSISLGAFFCHSHMASTYRVGPK